MTCEECILARTRRWHGFYRTGCTGCTTRGFARSLLAYDAVRTRKAGELCDALLLALPAVAADEALRQVWEWWRHDRGQDLVPEKIEALA